MSIEFNIGPIRTRIKCGEWSKTYKDHPKEYGEVSVYELKMLMTYKRKSEDVTRRGVWFKDYMAELKERHQHYVFELSKETDGQQREREVD